MKGALTVRINDGVTDRHVTQYASNLRFRKTAPGGFTAASVTIDVPRSMFPNLGPADKVFFYDARTGRTIFEGYAENPTATDGPAGQSFELSILGTTILAGDRSEPLLYLDRSFERWRHVGDPMAAASASANAGTVPTDESIPALVLQINPGQPVATGSLVQMVYSLNPVGLDVGAFAIRRRSGHTNATWSEQILLEGGVNWTQTQDTTPVTTQRFASTDGFVGAGYVAVRLYRNGGAANVASDNVWVAYDNVRVLGQLKDIYGNNVTAPHASWVRANEVVADTLGRMLLGMIDPVLSEVATTTTNIPQLTYFDGATASTVWDDMALYEPDHLWELLHSTSRGVVFRYRPWPTEPRYEVSVKDGYTAPGGEVDLCNRIAVYWTDEHGSQVATIATSVVPELGNRTKDAESITLPDGQGDPVNALRIGEQVLATKSTPPKAAKVTIRRPILDRLTGNTVMPWELEPGYLVAVRETGDTLRCTEMEYEDDPCATTLTLGEPTLTMEQRLAKLAKR